MTPQVDEEFNDDYQEYVTDEEEKYGFWYYGDLADLNIADSDDDDEEDFDDIYYENDDDDSDTKCQRVVLSNDKLLKCEQLERSKQDPKAPWTVSLIHATSRYRLFFIDGIRDYFYMLCTLKWVLVSFEELFNGKERNGVEFNRILCGSAKDTIFEMSDGSLYGFHKSFRVPYCWEKLELMSRQIEMISATMYSDEICFVKEDEPSTLYLYSRPQAQTFKIPTFVKIAKLFSPYNHVIIDSENRYLKLLEDNSSLEYISTPFEKISPIKQLVGSYFFSIALLENGTVWARGDIQVFTRYNDTYYQIDISLPNIVSVNAFGLYGVISTPSFHIVFGNVHVDNIQRMKLKRHNIKMKNLNIIETENKYFSVEGSENMFVYRKTHNPILLFSKQGLQLFRIRLCESLQSSVYYDISFKCLSYSLYDN
ncbi:predicted protein [Naegleria gruberi]|uniref:Predicted protein n=1 Tax=Naegleria gruberi TaxID=5762 RepID=D2W2W1_NAEGR|nr:uncharacterized protein NAEGRDRAFT_75732 [Naegleria gruberi]EFC36617.1 predicted protein [Naegleria gruberi]|eukprot:XP_002669361.1 predicted protein [Naegleria gruberi strain NEG-M]